MILGIYLVIAFIFNIIFVFLFAQYINISMASLAPAFVLLLMLFQGYYLYTNRGKKDFNSNNNSELTEKEWGKLSVFMSFSFFAYIPLVIPFILFFSDLIKIISVAVYFLAFLTGPLVYRIRYGKEIKSRLDQEEKELIEQKKREEL